MTPDYLNFTQAIAREAGALLKRELPKKHRIDFKGEFNLVTEVDRMLEELLVERICHATGDTSPAVQPLYQRHPT